MADINIDGTKLSPETTTTSESLSHYSDQVDTNENVSAFVYLPDLVINASDTVTTSESSPLLIIYNIAKSDTVSTSESLSFFFPILIIQIIDNRIRDENNNFIVDEDGNILTDGYTSEPIIATDVSNVAEALQINVFDSTSLSESIRLIVFSPKVSDTVTTSESIKLTKELNPNTVDQTLTSENITLIPELAISKFDTISSSESVNFNTDNRITVQDIVTSSESESVNSYVPSFLINDTVGLSENVNIIYSIPGISVSDSTTTSESTQVIISFNQTLSIAVSDTVNSNEFISVFIVVPHGDLSITVSDSTTTNESKLIVVNAHLIIAISYIQLTVPSQINLILVKRSIK